MPFRSQKNLSQSKYIYKIVLEIYFIIMSLIIAAVTIYLSVRNIARWTEVDMSTLKAKVFLDRSFLNYDFKLMLIIVALLSFHLIMEYLRLEDSFPQFLGLAYYSVLPLVLLILVMMQYKWYKLLHKKTSLKK
jgi:hypothetical protein